MELSIDVETYSDCPIKFGAQRYVDDETFEILLFAYSFDDEPVEVIDMTKDPLPERVVDALYNKEITKTAFNAAFEMLCLKKVLPRCGLHELGMYFSTCFILQFACKPLIMCLRP